MNPDRPKGSKPSPDMEPNDPGSGGDESVGQATEATVIVPIPEPRQSTKETAVGPIPDPKQSTKETAVGPMPARPQSHAETAVGPMPEATPEPASQPPHIEDVSPRPEEPSEKVVVEEQRPKTARLPAVAARTPAPVAEKTHGDPGPGDLLGIYRIVRLLGEGGMGKVFLAEHERLGRQVAIKLLHAEYSNKPEAVQRFFAEARAVNRIRDDHIVEITDFVEDNDHTYCVMEYIEGEDLAEILKDGHPLPAERVVHIGIQIAGVLAKVHEAGMIHRDLKPANVFISERDGHDLVKVLDFGIAKMWRSEDSAALNLTAEGIVLGTPEYMSPEQARDEVLDHRVDVYAMGLVLYAALTGKPPFTASSYAEMLVMHLTAAPPTPSEILATTKGMVPASLEALILDCLEKDRESRPADMHEVRGRLETCRDEIASGVVHRAGKPLARSGPGASPASSSGGKAWKIGAGALAAALGLAAALFVFSPFDSKGSDDLISTEPIPFSVPHSGDVDSTQAPGDVLGDATGLGTLRLLAPDRAAESKIEIVLNSRPPGSRVFRGDSTVHIGETPLTLEVERSEIPEVFRFELAGHESISEQIPLDEPTRLSVILPQERQQVRRPTTRRPTREPRVSQQVPANKSAAPRTKSPVPTKTQPETPELINPFGD